MDLTLAYRGRSAVVARPGGLAIALAANLRRDRVAFDAGLRHPIRFREAVSALHEVVVGDHRHAPADRTAHRAHLAVRAEAEAEIRRGVSAQARAAALKAAGQVDPAEVAALEGRYTRLRDRYWKARLRYSDHLRRHDPELWRRLVPCDPVITVAPDCLFLEGFSGDESGYACLTVDREAFQGERDVSEGTTNVDYSWSLYDHFQALRSYRETRFLVDPGGFEVVTAGADAHREEKVDLPPSWLRGFLSVQAAMGLPTRRVAIRREGLYGVLAFLRRHRAARGPRAIRFELRPGRPVAIVLEPWERRIVLHATPYDGPRAETIRVWGRDRLQPLARLLPLLDEAEVYLLGTGLPSFWSVRMGEIRLLLGLSGWTAHDWTGATALDALAPPAEPSEALVERVAAAFRDRSALGLDDLARRADAPPAFVAAALDRLARLGLVIKDLHADVYRWRQVMPVPLTLGAIGPDDPESAGARDLVRRRVVQVGRDERRPDGLRILEGTVIDRPVSLLFDADGRMLRGRCSCSHHFTGGLRRGPCRHLQALRDAASPDHRRPSTVDAWYASLAP